MTKAKTCASVRDALADRREQAASVAASRFSLDVLVNIATAIGRRVQVELECA